MRGAIKAGVLALLASATVLGCLALGSGVALANSASFSASSWLNWSQSESSTQNPNGDCYDGGLGTPGPAFGTLGDGAWVAQWTFGTWNAPPLPPAGATLVGATLSGQLADSGWTNYQGDYYIPPAGTYGFNFGAGAGTPYSTGRNSGCTYPLGYGNEGSGSVYLPGATSPSESFSANAYAVANTYVTDGVGDLFFAAGTGGQNFGLSMAPTSAATLVEDYAYTPTGIVAYQESPPTGSTDTQATISWNPNGNDSGTTYTLQRETLQGSGVVAGWATMYQGAATSVTTTSSWWSQSCGYGYVYRVRATGPNASTPWDTSAQWDEFPCTASVVGATPTSVTMSWPQVTAQTVPEVVWCEIGTPAGGVSCQQQRFDIGAGDTSATITGLVPNAEYAVFACSLTNAWGCPNPVGWTYAATPTLSLNNNNTAGLAYDQQPLTWTTGGNAPGTVYCLQQGTYAQSGAWQGGSCTAPHGYYGTATLATVDQSAGTSYAYSVWANNAGYSGASPASNSLPTQVASTPTLTITGPTTATMSWPVVAYMVTTGVACNVQGTGNWFYPGPATGGATSLAVTGLQPNTQYECTTYAMASNQGIRWWQGQAGGPAYTDATAPTGVTITGVTETVINDSWSANGTPTGTLYQTYLEPATGGGGVDWQTTYDLTATYGGLACGVTYTPYVQAQSHNGQWTAWTAGPATITVPCQPTGFSGSNGGLGWSPTAGRGSVHLSWQPATGATGYQVWVYDGNEYEAFNVGTATSWSTQAALIYPPDAALYPNVSEGSTAPPVFSHNGGGLNLRDLPHDLYCTTGTFYCGGGGGNPQQYWFAVDAYDASGSSASFQGGCAGDCYQPTLPLQTDPNAPVVTAWSVNGGGAYTYAATVPYNLQATESPSGIAAYALSNDGSTWTTYGVAGCTVGQVAACGSFLSATGTWTLTPGPGSKTIWARVESVAGVWSAPSATTTYVNVDTTVPTVNAVLDGGATSTTSTAATVGVSVSDPVTKQAGLTFEARYSTDGGQTWSPWASEGTSTAFSLAVTLPGGASGQRAVLVQVQDSDDNRGQGGATIQYVNPAGPLVGASTAGLGACVSTAGLPVPSGAVVQCTRQPQVTVPMAPPTGTVEMRASLDGVVWGQWHAVASSMPMNLGTSPGMKTVWVQYEDASGSVTPAPAHDPAYILLDPGPVTVTASWQGGAAATDSSGNATLAVQATDPAGSAGLTLAVTENGATLYQGAMESSVPLTLNGSGYQQVQVTVTDPAGNSAGATAGIYVE